MKTTLGQLFRYGIVGVLSNAVGYLLYLGITAAGMEHKLAMTLLYAVGVAQTFIFNKRWSFRHAGAHGTAFARYCIAYAAGYFINLAALFILVDRLGYAHQLVQGVMILALAAMLFMLQKFWVFRSTSSLPANSGSSL
ncbi:MAG: GtrA family protein [Thauera sp.]|nr:GtrA family protein [Thauera sp.]